MLVPIFLPVPAFELLLHFALAVVTCCRAGLPTFLFAPLAVLPFTICFGVVRPVAIIAGNVDQPLFSFVKAPALVAPVALFFEEVPAHDGWTCRMIDRHDELSSAVPRKKGRRG